MVHWRIPHLSPKALRALVAWTVVLVVVVLAIAELVWMGQRVSDQRALRAKDHSPPKVISLPLTGFKP
ncbi:MAG TPA: hypothetical protein VFC24_06845 [Casimicrobiaceae bacterium]|nr:hypothetical protein [Casimicrobiaceae bacterium]